MESFKSVRGGLGGDRILDGPSQQIIDAADTQIGASLEDVPEIRFRIEIIEPVHLGLIFSDGIKAALPSLDFLNRCSHGRYFFLAT